ncbi:MAG: molybdopterin molybdotransferase MoeA, partial [Acidobacteria bacterium]|nr:molybdopterin molybdotransferase MoeA [Acidobacteriota bacterium]
MIARTDAQATVLAAVERLDSVVVARDDSYGCVIAANVVAEEDVPPFANSAVDGYAVTLADMATGAAELAVSGTIAAGDAPEPAVTPGHAVRIMTGAPVPVGAEAIVMVEDSQRIGDDRVKLTAKVEANQAIRPAGDDVKRGDVVFMPGDVVTPAAIGTLAGMNVQSLTVTRRPTVAVLSTGDELVDDGGPLGPGQIRESNKTMLVRLVTEAGCDVADYGIVRDDDAELEEVLRHASQHCDAIVTSGGVSMGDYDVVKAVLGRIADMRWMQIAIKPAKPFAFGKLNGTPIFGLPGNPVSSFVSFELFARPALRKMAGHSQPQRPLVNVTAAAAFKRKPDGKEHFARAVVGATNGNLT